MSKNKVELLIAELGRSLGADLALDDEATVRLAVDEDITASIRFDEATDSLLLQTTLQALEPSPARLQRALAANFCWQEAAGATFGLDPLIGRLTLTRYCASSALDLDSLTEALESLLNQGELWTAVLGAIAGPKAETGADVERVPGPSAMAALRA